MSKKIDQRIKRSFFMLIVLEIVACYFAYYTLGEVKQMLLIFLFFLNVIPIILYFLRIKIISLVTAFIIGLFLIPNQFLLLTKWNQLKRESLEIKKYVYQYKKENEKFPENILTYSFKNKNLMANFSYQKSNKENFKLQYFIGTKGTTHFYNHNLGEWAYYAD
ncbi:hypothetical protein [uncultured Polaribacter sp.]|uniref:hypothetical protein n=1 Tax=uncultured Polaribacter sp. TaxID=174711 RepID=UPI0026162F23|nr:hypothetical protein [uncultured Polaribacter sp.]